MAAPFIPRDRKRRPNEFMLLELMYLFAATGEVVWTAGVALSL
jgi:hypothetical protein